MTGKVVLSSPRSRGSRKSRRLAFHLTWPLALLVAASAVIVNPASISAAPAARQDDRQALLDLVIGLAAPALGTYDRLTGVQALSDGNDNRLTFLLLGSDSRGVAVNRTDTILIASVKNGQISMASIPRDTGRIPNPFGGGYFRGKVNGIIRSYLAAGVSRDEALRRFEVVVENLLQIEIDYRAVMWFGGLTTLVGKIDPITVSIPGEIRDPRQLDDPDREWGVYFPKSTQYGLWDYNQTGRPLCNGLYKFDRALPVETVYHCHRALPFVRSRKGPGNNDWVRARRQQTFIYAAIKAVSPAELDGLRQTAAGQGSGKWITNMEITPGNAADLYNRLSGASFAHSVVFKPNTYATRIAGTSAWQLKLDAVRAWTAAYLD